MLRNHKGQLSQHGGRWCPDAGPSATVMMSYAGGHMSRVLVVISLFCFDRSVHMSALKCGLHRKDGIMIDMSSYDLMGIN